MNSLPLQRRLDSRARDVETMRDTLAAVALRVEAGAPLVTVHLFDEAGQPLATLTAPRVAYLESRRRFVADGGVRIEASGGKTLTAERVIWDEAARRVEAPGRVRFSSPTEQFEGENLSADERLETYTMTRITGQATIR